MGDGKEELREQIEDLQLEIFKLQQEKYGQVEGKLAAAAKGEDRHPNIRPRRMLKGHFGKVYAVSYGADSRHMASASQDGKCIIWDAVSGNKTLAINLTSAWVMTVAYSPNQNFVAAGGLDNVATIYTTEKRPPDDSSTSFKSQLNGHDGYMSCARWVGDDTMVTSSGDTTVCLWDVNTSRSTQTFQGHQLDVMSVCPSSDGNLFVSGSCDQSIKLWDKRAGGQAVATFLGHASDINSVDFFPDNSAFGSASDDCTLKLWDLRSICQLATYGNDEIQSGITSCAFSKSGNFLYAGYDEGMLIGWDVQRGTMLMGSKENQHDKVVSCLTTPPSGQCVATGSWDNLIRVWA
jgi:guanine nucleotide-binding protein G(I)/G(S)/G(T) subunit beta-1